MAVKHLTFATKKARAVLKKMRRYMRKQTATRIDLAKATGKSTHSIDNYLLYLRQRGEVICVAEPKTARKNGSLPGVWALNEESAPKSPPQINDDEIDSFKQKVVVCKPGEWAPCHQRDPMHSLLFGAPATAQPSHT